MYLLLNQYGTCELLCTIWASTSFSSADSLHHSGNDRCQHQVCRHATHCHLISLKDLTLFSSLSPSFKGNVGDWIGWWCESDIYMYVLYSPGVCVYVGVQFYRWDMYGCVYAARIYTHLQSFFFSATNACSWWACGSVFTRLNSRKGNKGLNDIQAVLTPPHACMHPTNFWCRRQGTRELRRYASSREISENRKTANSGMWEESNVEIFPATMHI